MNWAKQYQNLNLPAYFISIKRRKVSRYTHHFTKSLYVFFLYKILHFTLVSNLMRDNPVDKDHVCRFTNSSNRVTSVSQAADAFVWKTTKLLTQLFLSSSSRSWFWRDLLSIYRIYLLLMNGYIFCSHRLCINISYFIGTYLSSVVENYAITYNYSDGCVL
jgi:hypothetical protein